MDIAFVVLHYMAFEETVHCVQCIQNNMDAQEYHIVVVDNASSNGSGKRLYDLYQNDEKVTVLCNDKNLGFARGNNVGFQYAKEHLTPDFICMLNNDVYLLDKTLFRTLAEEYVRSGFDVLGPMVLTRDGRCDVNPDRRVIRSKKDIDRLVGHYRKILKRYRRGYGKGYYWLANAVGRFLGIQPSGNKSKRFFERQENVKLHGCCLFFSKDYIQAYDGLDPSTFLYFEEEFLARQMELDGRKMVYLPDIHVYHVEDAATDLDVNQNKLIFIYENYIASLEKLQKLYELEG